MEIVRPKTNFSCPQRVIICLTEPDLLYFSRALALKKGPKIFLSRLYLGEGKALAGPALGGPQVAILLEHLLAAGAEEILLFGWAGALEEGLPLGSLFLPEGALSEEGTSAHYGAHPFPSPRLFWEIYHGLIQSGLDFEVGQVVSTDALYRETETFCQRYQQRARVVEMECAAAFSVAHFRGKDLAALLFISDRVFPRRERAGKKEFSGMREAVLPLFRYFWRSS